MKFDEIFIQEMAKETTLKLSADQAMRELRETKKKSQQSDKIIGLHHVKVRTLRA